MKLLDRYSLLKILALTAVYAFVYSAAVMLRTAVFKEDGGIFALLMFAVVCLSGQLSGWLFYEKSLKPAKENSPRLTSSVFLMQHLKISRRFIAGGAAWSIMLLPALAAYMAYNRYGIFRSLFETVFSMIAYTVSLKQSKLDFTRIFKKSTVYAGFIILAACLEAPCFIKSLLYLRPWVFAASYLFIFAFLIIKNQEDIDSNIFNKKHIERSILPKNLRRFNLASVCILFLVVLLFFNFKAFVINVIEFMAILTARIIGIILWLIIQLYPQSEGDMQMSGAAAQQLDMLKNQPEIIYPFRNLIYNTLQNFVVLYALYRLLVILARKAPGFIKKAAEWIRKILSIENGEKNIESIEYIDETEIVKPAQKHIVSAKKGIRRSRRNLSKISDPVKMIRQMYSAILHILPSVGVYPEKSDTTLEIVRKAAGAGEYSGIVDGCLAPFTEIYNVVRYSEKLPDSNMMLNAGEYYRKLVKKLPVGKALPGVPYKTIVKSKYRRYNKEHYII